MSMRFVPGWEKPKLTVIPSDADLATRRTGLSGTQQKNQGIHPNQIEYAKKNNALREADQVFLTFFGEASVRAAVQKSQTLFKHEPAVNSLLSNMVALTPEIVIDQGTHQAEDRHGGGFKLHFDARDVAGKCFHMYVGQDVEGHLQIIEISYMNAGAAVAAHPSA